ncbi:MAG: HDOD domain-containing protein [Opitutae bacterium]|nr:HDOD domain-containing protein [Opitutae bacterium]
MQPAPPLSSPNPALRAFSPDEIRRRIDGVPKLASLQSVNRALAQLVNSEQSYNAQIAEIIRRDPSLTARLLRMVNSVYFGLTAKVNNIEEAVFYLGLRQIKELSMATPIIEEMNALQRPGPQLPWKDLWQHSIGTAIMTRELLVTTSLMIDDDTDYIVGLLHNIGKVVMAYAFPDHFPLIVATPAATTQDICALERAVIGWDHAQIGSHYLQRHQLSPEITTAILYHNEPENAPQGALLSAAVQIADHLVRYSGIPGGLEKLEPVPEDSWGALSGWTILFGTGERETLIARAAIRNSLQRLPGLLQGLL